MEITHEQTYTFYVDGMHCQACVVLTDSELNDHPKITSARSRLATCSVEVKGNFGAMSVNEIAEELTQTLVKHGYSLSLERKNLSLNRQDFYIAIPLALLFIIFFIWLQKLGIVNLVNSTSVTYTTALVIGVIASLSTCMAVVGGLVLSMSATFARSGNIIKPQILFHVSRLLAFFVLGGIIGVIGSAFTLGIIGTFILSLIIGIIMIILGLNLLNLFTWTKRLQPTLPKFITQSSLNIAKLNHTLTPALLGIITFFLPCGFTQSMQIYALSTGSFVQGAVTMLVFAVGTLPVLALMSFSSVTIPEGRGKRLFFKTVGLVIILFGFFNIINSLTAVGIIPPIITL